MRKTFGIRILSPAAVLAVIAVAYHHFFPGFKPEYIFHMVDVRTLNIDFLFPHLTGSYKKTLHSFLLLGYLGFLAVTLAHSP